MLLVSVGRLERRSVAAVDICSRFFRVCALSMFVALCFSVCGEPQSPEEKNGRICVLVFKRSVNVVLAIDSRVVSTPVVDAHVGTIMWALFVIGHDAVRSIERDTRRFDVLLLSNQTRN